MPHELMELTLDEVSAVDAPANKGARVLITKQEENMPTITEAIAKALAPDPSDTEREAADKALVRKQIETGALKAESYGAEMALQAHADALRKSDPDLSPEQAFVKAMDQHPDLARLALP